MKKNQLNKLYTRRRTFKIHEKTQVKLKEKIQFDIKKMKVDFKLKHSNKDLR